MSARSADWTPGSLSNGSETTVSSTAVQVAAANGNRRAIILQNVGSADCRVGATGITATTGVRLEAGASLVLEPPFAVQQAIFAIREDSTDTTISYLEVLG